MVVDTGATYCVVPRPLAEELGIRPTRRIRVTLADGTRIERDMGQAEVEYRGFTTPTWVLLGDRGDIPNLGAYALEGLGLEVDPTSRELRPSEAYLLSTA